MRRLGLALIVLILASSALSEGAERLSGQSASADSSCVAISDADLLAAAALRAFVLADSGGAHRSGIAQMRVVLVSSAVVVLYPGDSVRVRESLTNAALPRSDRTYFVLKSPTQLARRRSGGVVEYVGIESIDIAGAEATVMISSCRMSPAPYVNLQSGDGDILRFRRQGASWQYVGVDEHVITN